MITYVNTDKVNTIADEISKAATELESEFTALYKRFSNVPTVTKEWIGNQANTYFSRIAADKQQYINLANNLQDISKELRNEAADISSSVKLNNVKD